MKLRSIILALAALTAPALGADNTQVKDSTGATVVFGDKDVSGVHYRKDIIVCSSDQSDCIEKTQAVAGSDATKAVAVQGITGGKNINVNCASGCAGGTQYTEDVAATTGSTLTAAGVVQTASPADAATDGDWAWLQMKNGRLWAEIGGTGSIFGTATDTAIQSGACTTALGCFRSMRDDLRTQASGGATSANQTTLNSSIGATSDTAWASGSGSAISLLKTIATASLDTTPLSTNATQVNGNTILAGNGVTGTGSIRVTVSSDNAPFAVKTDQTTHGTTDLVASDQTKIGGVAISVGNGVSGTGVQRVTLASDSTGQVALATGANTIGAVYGFAGTATTTITRPADANAYAANDAFADSTSAPTSGGFTLSNMCRASGGSGLLTDLVFIYSTASAVSGELWIYDSAPTAQNDNAAWSVSDSDQLKLVAKVPFSTVADAVNAVYTANGLSIGYTCSGSANLRYMVKITTAYTPASGDTLTVRAKFQQTN